MAKLRINGDSSGYVDLEAPNAASSSTLDLDQVPQKNAATTAFTGNVGIGTASPGAKLHVNSASTRVKVSDTGTSFTAQDFLSNSNTVRATIGVERSTGGGLFVGSSAYAAVFGTASSGNTQFATNNNIRMTIDANGYVTTPYQPRVFAQGNINNWTTGVANQIYTAWQTTGADGSYAVGISFNAANGRFTVPVAGTYYIHSSKYCRIGPSYNTSAARLNLRKNGGQWTNQHIHSYENIPDISISVEGLVTMAANDYFTIDDSYATEHYRGAVHTYLHAYLVG